MLDELKKKLGLGKLEKPAADATFSLEDLKELVADNERLEALVDTNNAAHATALSELQTKLDEANAKLDAAAAAKATAAAEAAAAKLAARKQTIVDVIGEAQADAFMAATGTLDDAAFEAVALALTGKATAEANSPLFKEAGVDAQAGNAKVAETETPEMKLLRDKYKSAE